MERKPEKHAGWNVMAGIGPNGLKGRGLLEVLRLERVGITGFQLRKIVERNEGLKELYLRKVDGVDGEFLRWLGTEWGGRKRLRVLEVEECDGFEVVMEEDADWVEGLESLESLSFHRSACVDAELVTQLNEEVWKIKDFIPSLDIGSPVPSDMVIEVDPDYK